MKLIDYHLPLRRQDSATNCGMFATSFAIEAKSNMRSIDITPILTDQLTDMWEYEKGEGQGFLMPLINSLRFFEGKALAHESGQEVEIYNTQTAKDLSFENICLLVDNMVSPILGISFKGRRFRDGYIAYSGSGGTRSKQHIVCVIGYTDKYLILKDSAGSSKRPDGSYNRIYKEDMGVVVDCVYFNVKKYEPKLIPPVKNMYVTQSFGARPDYYKQFGGWYEKLGHIAIDIRVKTKEHPDGIGEPILASHTGRITKQEYNKYLGKFIEVTGNDLKTVYCHLDTFVYSLGEDVRQGQIIGKSGTSGNSSAPHLHFEVWQDGKPVDPMLFLD